MPLHGNGKKILQTRPWQHRMHLPPGTFQIYKNPIWTERRLKMFHREMSSVLASVSLLSALIYLKYYRILNWRKDYIKLDKIRTVSIVYGWCHLQARKVKSFLLDD